MDDLSKFQQYASQPSLDKIGLYQIIEEVGRGGMGKVYRAYHPGLDRIVAIKVMLNIKANNERKRFLAEAKMTAKLKHPSIVEVYDVGTIATVKNEKVDYIVMDFIKGDSLFQLLKSGPLPPRQSLEIIKKIALAMDYAHSNNVIHRDLKPANILIQPADKFPLIVDFGLAKNIASSQQITQSNEIVGTPRYMAPEQVQAEKITPTTDIYALGVILYEMLTGTPAVAGKVSINILYNVIHSEPVPLCKQNPQLAKDLQIICEKAFAKNPNERYASAKEFANDLELFLNGEAILAHPVSIALRYVKKVRYHYKWLLAIASCAIFVVILFSMAFKSAKIEQQKKIQKHLQKVEQILALEKTIKNKEIIYIYMQASTLLEKVLLLAPKDKQITARLYHIQKKLGMQALNMQNYLISYIAFKRCYKLGYKKQAANLLALLKQKKQEIQKKQIARLEKIMLWYKKKVHRDISQWHIIQIMRMTGAHTIKKLLSYLDSKFPEQRGLAAIALGRMGDTTTKINGKDVVEHLVSRLEKVDPHKREFKAGNLIWALGWLKDSRANQIVTKVRNKVSTSSRLWQTTETPYRWIPLGDISAKNVQDFVKRGHMKLHKKDFSGAVADYSKAIALNPKNVIAYNNRGLTYRFLGNVKEAIKDYTRAIKVDPKYAYAYINRGSSYQIQRHIDKAIVDFTKAISLRPLAIAYCHRGEIYIEKNKLAKAMVDYNKAIALSPRLFHAYNGKATVFFMQKNFVKALEYYQKTAFLNPTYEDVFYNIGLCYENLKDNRQAMEAFNSVIRFNPRYAKAYYDRARIYTKQKEFSKAIKDYSQVIKLDPKYTLAYNNRGLIYQGQKKIVLAMADYNKAISVEPDLAIPYYNRGNMFFDQKKYSTAIEDYKQAIKLDSKYILAYLNCGVCYYLLKQYDKAIANYKKIMQLDPRNSTAYNNCAWSFYYLKKYKQAVFYWERYLKLYPNAPGARKIRARLRHLKKQF